VSAVVWPQIEKKTHQNETLIKSLSILAIGGIFAGTALAGPGDAYAGYPAASFAKARAESKSEHGTIALFRPGVTPAGAKAKSN
jgi:hypothetical protein